MSLVEHLKELRRRVLIALAAIGVGTVVGYMWYATGVFGTPSLGEILKEPYCALPSDLRFGSNTNDCRLLATAPFEMFMLRLKIGFLAGLVLSAPVWLSQLWGFVTPGLKKKEKLWTRMFVGTATVLFVVGAVLAYFVIAFGLEFLMSMGDKTQIAALNGTSYFNFLLILLLIFGVSFEVPLITVMLNLVGILPYQVLKDKRRIIIMFLFVFAAFVTPGQDPVSMVILALSLSLMMEFATQFARINDKRQAKKAGLDTEAIDSEALDDEEASSIGRASSLSGTGTVNTATPITPTTPVNSYNSSSLDDIL